MVSVTRKEAVWEALRWHRQEINRLNERLDNLERALTAGLGTLQTRAEIQSDLILLIQDKLNGTADGEPRIERSTTPICESTENASPCGPRVRSG